MGVLEGSMAKPFIRLTSAAESRDNAPVWVNATLIRFIRASTSGTGIHFDHDHMIYVSEDENTVAEQANDALK